MSSNPYSPPTADLAMPRPAGPEIPPEIARKIRSACIAGLICGGMTSIALLMALFGKNYFGFDAWNLTDVALVFGLTYGIYRKSRVCAVVILAYFVISKIMIALETGSVNGIFLSLVFAYYFWQGVVGTVAFHKLPKA